MATAEIATAPEHVIEKDEHDFIEEYGFDRETLRYPWSEGNSLHHLDIKVDQLIADSKAGEIITITREEAIKLASIRFGVALKYLPAGLKEDEAIIKIANDSSSWRTLLRETIKTV